MMTTRPVAALGLAVLSLALTACKSGGGSQAQTQASAAHIPGPFTRIGEHMTPAFQEVVVFARNTQYQALNTYGAGTVQAGAWLPCADLGVAATLPSGRNQVVSCTVKVLGQDKALLAAKISNGWLILADAQDTRNVTEADFAQATQ